MRKGLKIKIGTKGTLPTRGTVYSAGWDLTASSIHASTEYIEYGTDIFVEIPVGYVGLLFPRSSVSKQEIILANCVGVIDSDYRGEIKLRFKSFVDPFRAENVKMYHPGDKVGQLLIIKLGEFEYLDVVDELDTTDRGEGGFGHTGK